MELISKEEAMRAVIETEGFELIDRIKELPTVELKGSFKPDGEYEYIIPPEKIKAILLEQYRPKGRWITDIEDINYGKCTNCGWVGDVADNIYYKYCPNCGAEMESEE